MEVPRFWARAWATVPARDGHGTWRLLRWGWSAESQADAQARAEAARERSERLWRQDQPDFISRSYEEYAARPPREEILEELTDDAGKLMGLVTRNAYGAMILNTDRLLMIDVDGPETPPWWQQAWQKLRGRPGRLSERLDQALRENGPERFRVYRTAAGWRLLEVAQPAAGVGPRSLATLQRFPVDPHYLRLCRRQQTFRARLTPKPWRCNSPRPPVGFPRQDGEAVAEFAAWLAHYHQAIAGYRTAELTSGQENPVHADLRLLVELHDRLCGVDRSGPLA